MTDNVDANLLRLFVSIFEKKSVSQVANLHDMSQSGVSTALSRLRLLLKDDLFIKTGKGMVPTNKARESYDVAKKILALIDQDLIHHQAFDPLTSTRKLRIALSDIGEGIYLPALINKLAERAPNMEVQSVQLPPTELNEALSNGNCDLAVGYFPDLEGGHIFHKRIGLHAFTCLANRDHPLVKRPPSVNEFLSAPHIVVESIGRSQEIFEEFLKTKGMARKVLLTTPHFMSIPVIVAQTQSLAVVPQAISEFWRWNPALGRVKMPFPTPQFQVNMFWHRTQHADPAHQWLRSIFSELISIILKREYHISD